MDHSCAHPQESEHMSAHGTLDETDTTGSVTQSKHGHTLSISAASWQKLVLLTSIVRQPPNHSLALMADTSLRSRLPSEDEHALWYSAKMMIASECATTALHKWGQNILHGFHAHCRAHTRPRGIGATSSADVNCDRTLFRQRRRPGTGQADDVQIIAHHLNEAAAPNSCQIPAVSNTKAVALSKWRTEKAGRSHQDSHPHLPTFVTSSQGMAPGGGAADAGASPEPPCLFTTAGSMLDSSKKRKVGNQGAPNGGQTAHQPRPPWKKRLGCASSRAGFVPPCRANEAQDRAGGTNTERQPGMAGGDAGTAAKRDGKSANDASGDDQSAYGERTRALLQLPDGSMPESIQKMDPHIVNAVCDDILETAANVHWDDIAGQQQAKQMIQELVVWPMKNPGLFVGARTPARGLLLFGPPGTGKTLIGKAIACNINATFFNISASSLTSKWIGESEKLVKALFAVAKAASPSVIFIDEVDSVLTARKSEGEHEASRRLKTELMVQTEGCGLAEGSRVLLVGATNRPEELDEAARRRMPKQLYVSLPCGAARLAMLQRQFYPQGKVKTDLSGAEVSKVVEKTHGYSGADMKNLIQEACQGPVREIIHQRGSDVSGLTEDDLRAVKLRDFKAACKAQKASVHPDEIQRYIEYNARHGASLTHAGPDADADISSADEW
eukprot:jgi/Ulvmu1/7382/UM036_0042.1